MPSDNGKFHGYSMSRRINMPLKKGLRGTAIREGNSTMPDTKPLPRWFRAANRAVGFISRLGFTMGPVCVLTVPGRRTGKPRSTPVSPLTVQGLRYVVSGLPNSDWARNVRAAGHGQLSRGRHREPVTLIEVTDSRLKEQVMRAYPREVPRGAPMFAQLGIVSSTDPDAFAASADRVAIFELQAAASRLRGVAIARPGRR
jgi:deazaflavin-dependent oxidoreductase (nitroreductase family)